tara:strand:+ start:592 stop:792 length:201 start_codon:yes stop_codon:yes gene_type:complete
LEEEEEEEEEENEVRVVLVELVELVEAEEELEEDLAERMEPACDDLLFADVMDPGVLDTFPSFNKD